MEKDYLRFKDLMSIRLTNIVVCHKDDAEQPQKRIAYLDKKVFSEYGAKIWNDVMDAKVEAYNGSYVVLSGVGVDRVSAFHRMMTGQDNHKIYERCFLPRKYTMIDDMTLADTTYKENAVNLMSVYECMKNIPEEERITGFFSSCGEYYVKSNTKPEMVKELFMKALDKINMSSEQFNKCENLNSRQAIRLCMKENLMADKIKIGDTVAFVTPEPVSAPGVFELTGGLVEEINEMNKSCKLYSTFAHIDVPFKYIFARYDKNSFDSYWGWQNAEILLDARESDGMVMLEEAREKYCIEHQSEMEEEATIMMGI